LLNVIRRTAAVAALVLIPGALRAADPKYLQDQIAAQRIRSEGSDSGQFHRSRRAWLISIPVFVLANALDAHSSWGKHEINGLLQGRYGKFDGRSLAVKSLLAGAVIAGEYGLARARDGDAGFTGAVYLGSASSNFVTSAILSVAAVRNYRVPRTVAASR